MSLFANLGGPEGDIWALSGISFANPVSDILEKSEFSLEELLEEDELIQEVKSLNDQLISYLTKPEILEKLIDFVTTPPSINSSESLIASESVTEMDSENPVKFSHSEMRTYKYPYMSCEVICCEVPDILNRIVLEKDGIYLNRLLSFLDTDSPALDYYLAGYFEKILEMLFRRITGKLLIDRKSVV